MAKGEEIDGFYNLVDIYISYYSGEDCYNLFRSLLHTTITKMDSEGVVLFNSNSAI